MKFTFTFLSLILMFSISYGQNCQPDPSVMDTTGLGIIPQPYIDSLGEGGFAQVACHNVAYETTISAFLPESIKFQGIDVVLDSMAIDKNSGGVEGLPSGLSYVCEPPNCVFVSQTLGCVKIFGTVEDTVAAKNYDIALKLVMYSPLANGVPIDYPGTTFPGSYFITVSDNEADCDKTGVLDLIDATIEVFPNPTSGKLAIHIFQESSNTYVINLVNSIGQSFDLGQYNVSSGNTALNFDLSGKKAGLYFLNFRNEQGVYTQKILIE